MISNPISPVQIQQLLDSDRDLFTELKRYRKKIDFCGLVLFLSGLATISFAFAGWSGLLSPIFVTISTLVLVTAGFVSQSLTSRYNLLALVVALKSHHLKGATPQPTPKGDVL